MRKALWLNSSSWTDHYHILISQRADLWLIWGDSHWYVQQNVINILIRNLLTCIWHTFFKFKWIWSDCMKLGYWPRTPSLLDVSIITLHVQHYKLISLCIYMYFCFHCESMKQVKVIKILLELIIFPSLS